MNTLLLIFLGLARAHIDPGAAQPPDAADLAVAQSVGMTAEALAAAGAGPQSIALVVESLATAEEAVASLAASELVEDSSAAIVGELALASWLKGGTGEFATASAAMQQASQATLEARLAVHAAASGTLSEEVRARLLRVWMAAPRRAPVAFKVLDGSAEWWSDVEAALIAERRALRLGESLDATAADLLTEIRSNPEVVAAQAALNADLAQIQAEFAESASPP